MRTCAWHECGKAFEPSDPRQEFCCVACRKDRGAWKARRGGPLVDMLLSGDVTALMETKAKIKQEIENAVARHR
jgi:hypothetical protein